MLGLLCLLLIKLPLTSSFTHLTTVLMMNFHKVRDYIYNLCTNTYTLYTIHLCIIANVFNYLYFHLFPFFCLLSLCISYSLSPPLQLSPSPYLSLFIQSQYYQLPIMSQYLRYVLIIIQIMCLLPSLLTIRLIMSSLACSSSTTRDASSVPFPSSFP